MDRNKKELFCYIAIFAVLVIVVVLNNLFWKLGKEKDETNNTVYLESNNVIYDVPYSEEAFD